MGSLQQRLALPTAQSPSPEVSMKPSKEPSKKEVVIQQQESSTEGMQKGAKKSFWKWF